MDFGKRFMASVLGVMAAALVGIATPAAVGATAPVAYNPNLPVAACGTGCGSGAAGVPVSAVRSNNPNETAAYYRPGGTSQVYWVETTAVTNGGTQVRDIQTGAPIYRAEIVNPVTYNPPNGTVTGEPQGYIVLSPYTDYFYTSPAYSAYPYGNSYPYGYPYGPYYPR